MGSPEDVPVIHKWATEAARKHRWLGSGADLACPGRPVICRRDGCHEVVADKRLRLCAGHLVAYEAEHGLVRSATAATRTATRARR